MGSKVRQRIVIIGGVACGPKAAARARRRDASAEIIIIERGGLLSYAGCGLPYYIGGTVPEIEGLMTTTYGAVRDVTYFGAVKNVQARMRTEARAIDPGNKTVKIVNLDTGREESLEYDKLVLATGASPIIPPIEGMNLKQVFSLRHPEDAAGLRACVEGGKADKVVIVGGGRVGLEVADAFGAQAVETTIVELADQLLANVIDRDMSDVVVNSLRAEKVNIRLNEKVLKLEGDESGKVAKVITDKGEIETDAVLVAVGVRPNIELAKSAGLKIGKTGAIEVDNHMRTSNTDIYAGGDCVECVNRVTGDKIYAPQGSTANRHGRIIGDNVTGGDTIFPGLVGTSVMKTLGLNIGRTGLTETEALKRGFKPVVALSPAPDRSHFFPGGKYILIKLVADGNTRKVLGAQALGPGDVVRRVDVVASVLSFGGTLDDLAELDLSYAPPFATVIENVAHAANIIRNKLDGLSEGIRPTEVRKKMAAGDDFVILDIRIPEEIKKTGISDERVCCIPLHELRARVGEIPRDKEIMVLCPIGARAYEGTCMLKREGFDRAKFIEGGLHWWDSTKPAVDETDEKT